MPDDLFARLLGAPAAYGAFPFWFWNDDLDEGELLRQLHAFHQAGCGGVVIHPRIGLSARVGYLTETYFRLVRRVVEECAALGLQVILYDEGSYPSGSAAGLVVAENPDYAAQALFLARIDISGPWTGYWRAALGRLLVANSIAVVLARTAGGVVRPETARLLQPDGRGLVRVQVDEGEWTVLAAIAAPSGGTIRGVLPAQDDGTATAPPAGDIMNPAAVSTFLRLTHDAYARALEGYLGTTVVAMFTDEPSPTGRGPRRGAQPFTSGFEHFLAEQLGWPLEQLLTWLPALWVDYGPETEAFRRRYARAVGDRISQVFYAAQANWCREHGIALTGHPADSNDMTSLATFTWPGQDMVWRYVVPGNDSALVGAHSVAAKAATSAARARRTGRPRIASEIFGAYGWRLSLDEAKWLLDWHLARGNNLYLLHAFFYSVRGGRAFESEPDLGLHNAWWPHFTPLLHYLRRLSYLLTESEPVCHVAVLGSGYTLPWRAARTLYQHQIDFLYLDEPTLAAATVERSPAGGTSLRAGTQAYRALIVDGDPDLGPAATERLRSFAQAGGTVFYAPDQQGAAEGPQLEPAADDSLIADLHQVLPPDLTLSPAHPGLRILHLRQRTCDLYLLFNEGETAIDATLTIPAPASPELSAEWWDVLRGRRSDARGTLNGTGANHDYSVKLSLPRRESLILALATGTTSPTKDTTPASVERQRETLALDGPWQATTFNGDAFPAQNLGDWAAVPALERFSGTVIYSTSVDLPSTPRAVELDLGTVGQAATVYVNDHLAGRALWAPYVIRTHADSDTGPSVWRAGRNTLAIHVTNSAANAYEGAMLPSGLIGPVRLHLW